MITEYERARRIYKFSMIYVMFGINTGCGAIFIALGVMAGKKISEEASLQFFAIGIIFMCVSVLTIYLYMRACCIVSREKRRRRRQLQLQQMNPVIIVIREPVVFYYRSTQIPIAEPV